MGVKWALALGLLSLFVTTETFAKRGYLITGPRTFRSGVAEKLRVQLFDTNSVWIVRANLYLSSRSSTRHQLIASAKGQFTAQRHGTLTLKVSENVNILWTGKNGKLVVSATNRRNTTEMNETEVAVTIEKRQPSLFIQTDKPIYKPGQEVRMRIIGTDPDLKPLTGKVTRISIMTPSRVRIMQWDNQSFVDGIVSLKMQLSKQPVLGIWKIEALVKDTTVVQTIKIDKYVLPKFQVTIKPPSYVAVDSREVTASVCATYTYGQPVQGTVEATFTLKKDWLWRWWQRRNRSRVIQVTKKIKGCQDFRFTNKELGLFGMKNDYWGLHLQIQATVTEEATGVPRNATSVKIDIVKNRIKLQFTRDTPRQLKPGLPFHGKLSVTEPNGAPLSGEKVTITAYSDHVKVYEKQFSVTNGLIQFTIANVSSSTADMHIQARHRTYLADDPVYRYWSYNTGLYLRAWYSPSGSFLSLDRQTNVLRVGKTSQISLKFTTKAIRSPIILYYSVMCKGELVSTGKFIQTFSPIGGGVASGTARFPVTQAMVPSGRLLVYYIRDNGETVADSMEIDVEDKLENQVSVRFDDKIKRPGEKTQVIIKAAPGSRVAIATVDKSVHLLRAANELTESKVISVLKSLDVGPAYNYRTKKCSLVFNWFPWRPLDRRLDRRDRRSVYRRDDSSKAFNDAGMIFITNLKVESAPCQYRLPSPPTGGRQSLGGGDLPEVPETTAEAYDDDVDEDEVRPKQVRPKIRQEFPETWLWTEEEVDKQTGKKTITATVPDTITSWYASAFAMSKTRGIGVSSPTSLTVFQPFFVSLTLPYSIIRGEELTVISTIFNYMSRCLTIRVSMESTQDFRLTSGSSFKLCVCRNEAKSVNFTIVASKLGHIPLTVTAKHVQQSVCSNSSTEASVGLIDTVRRKLLVQPEGVRKEYTFSKLVCPQDSPNGALNEKINLTLPQSVVPGSVYATLSAIGDLMGPALNGLDNLLRMPMGCGEQNMVLFAPNIYVLQYLKRTRQLTEAIRKKAIQFLQIGYQRELTYKRTDGSYSAFGNNDKEGSLWLTAFVLRSFAQARQFIFVDEKELQQTINWLKSKQTSEGCFPKHGKLFNKNMKGGVTSPVTLTTFTVLALLEAGVSTQDRAITRALDNCIMAKVRQVKDSYSLALLAYTFAIAKHPDQDIILKRLEKKAISKDGLMHWEQETSSKPKNEENVWFSPYYRAPAADIEMTAYALMATIASGSSADTLRAIPIVRWLSTQRNGLGGFQSTQDTCVGLMSLAQFAAQAYKGGISLTINIQGAFAHSFTINDRDRLVLKRVEIPSLIIPTELTMTASGSGCALVQADVSYYVPKVIEKPAFNLTVDVRRRPNPPATVMRTEAGGALCVPLEMRICARWLRKGTSNMAIVRVKLVSGFRADEESLDTLVNLPGLFIMKHEIEGQEVHIYFDEIKDVCFSLGILQETLVENTKPAAVTVYDYYEPVLSATKFYRITKDLCLPDDS